MANIVEDEVIKAEIQEGLSQVDENLIIGEFSTVFEQDTRKLRVFFTATNRITNETIEINQELR